MSFALDTLVIFLFILIPGITFRRFYFQGEFSKQFNSKSLAHSMSASIFPGIIIQFFTVFLYKSYINDIDGGSVEIFYKKLSENTLPENIFDSVLLINLLTYIVLMLMISFFFAEISFRFVKLIRADRWSTIMRFRNHWNYYFKGELKGFKEYRGLIKGDLVEVRADVLLRVQSEEPRLYSGVLVQHTLNSETHELENVFMSQVAIYKKDSNTGVRIKKDIPGDLMILNANDIININLNYITTPSKKRDFTAIITLLFLIASVYIIFTNYPYFVASTIIKTILLKAFFLIYLLIFITLMSQIFGKNEDVNKRKNIINMAYFFAFLTVFYYLMRYVFF